MSAYKFRFQALLDLRATIRDQRRNELAEAIDARQQLVAQQATLSAEQQELQSVYQSATAQGPLDVRRVLDLQQYERSLKARAQELTRRVQGWTQEIQLRQAALADADRDAKILQKLDERHRHEHQQLAARQESMPLG
jgi:flagellar protein FliJ